MVYSDCSWQDSYFLVVSTGTTVGAGVKIGIAVEVGVIVGDTEDVEVPSDAVFGVWLLEMWRRLQI